MNELRGQFADYEGKSSHYEDTTRVDEIDLSICN